MLPTLVADMNFPSVGFAIFRHARRQIVCAHYCIAHENKSELLELLKPYVGLVKLSAAGQVRKAVLDVARRRLIGRRRGKLM